jgi:hypothetical protein
MRGAGRICADCGRPAEGRIPQRPLCLGCRRRRHYHPQPCPGCEQVRPLAYPLAGRLGEETVCAGCAGVASTFACTGCGSETHPYGSRRCARCILTERLTELLTDPATGAVNERLRPVFEAMIGSERPQTTIW